MENVANKFEITVNKFTEESSNKFAKELNEATNIDPNHPIVINIDSYGGYVYSLINMLETMRSIPNPIITVCKGKAMSCGAILLAMGDQRFCGKDSSIMIHEISGGAIGHIDDLKVDTEESIRLNVQILGQLAERMGMTFEELKSKIHGDQGRRDWYLTAETAKENGLIDQIGMPIIKPIVMYSVDVASPRRIKFEKVNEEPTKKRKKRTTKTVSKQRKRK